MKEMYLKFHYDIWPSGKYQCRVQVSGSNLGLETVCPPLSLDIRLAHFLPHHLQFGVY
jgi:hypothetical protein